MPGNYGVLTAFPIVGPNGVTIAKNWADLLDGNISKRLDEAAVLDFANKWWSGSDAHGNMLATCGEWTMTNGAGGAQGDLSVTHGAWLSDGNIPECTATGKLLCIGW